MHLNGIETGARTVRTDFFRSRWTGLAGFRTFRTDVFHLRGRGGKHSKTHGKMWRTCVRCVRERSGNGTTV